SAQNGLSGGFSLPQALHCHGSGDPQSPQNFLAFAMFAPQRGQIMRPSSFGRSATSVASCRSTAHVGMQRPMTHRQSGLPARGGATGGRNTQTYTRDTKIFALRRVMALLGSVWHYMPIRYWLGWPESVH